MTRVTQKRLKPLARRALILDHAANVVSAEGTLEASMARIAKEAGVSKALIYQYFPNRVALLGALLEREYQRMQREQIQLAKLANNFEDFVRRTTHAYLQHCAERGPFIQMLLDEPALRKAADKAESRDEGSWFIAQQVKEHLRIDIDDKELFTITDICVGLSRAAGRQAQRNKSLDELVELTTAMILASIDASSKLLIHWRQKEAAQHK